MKVDVKKVDTLKRVMTFEIPKDRVSAVMDEVYNEIGKYAKIKGFRPGKVPRNILVNSHGKIAKEEAIKKIIPQAYHQGIEQEKLNPIDLPEITEVALNDGILKFTATLDIRPEVHLGKYKGIKVVRKSSAVTDEDINKTLDFFKKSRGEGKEETVIDDAFANGMGFPNLEEFKKALTRQLEMDKDRQNRMDVENQVVDHLLKTSKLVVPQSLVKRQMDHRVHDALRRMKAQGMGDEDLRKKDQELRAALAEPVERDVKVFLVLEEIAKVENIEAAGEQERMPDKVMAFLLKEAAWEEAK